MRNIMGKRVLAVFLAVIMALSYENYKVAAAEAPKESELYAKSAVLMDGDSGRILYEKNGYEGLANASTTKILTCILALENGDLQNVVEVSALAASQPKVHLGMRQGQQFYLKDMLYGLMLESFNDCAVAIAEHIAGTVEDFAAMMNRKAQELGCTDSYFITPNGLDAQDETDFHHTTAADLALIMRYCIMQSEKADEFLQITKTQQYGFTDVGGSNRYSCSNHNAFLQMMDGALSGKTGFTGTAGYCYVGALEREKKTYIVALLACGWPNNKTYKWTDTTRLMTYGIEEFNLCDLTVMEPDVTKLEPLFVEDAQGDGIGEAVYVSLQLEKQQELERILLTEGEEVEVKYAIAEKLKAPVEEGTFVGTVTYLLHDEVLKEYNVVTKQAVKKIDYGWCCRMVRKIMLL
jgi:D-alanyl-D-alanine carboxypeptidase (penicillin-binding protein 5/6)